MHLACLHLHERSLFLHTTLAVCCMRDPIDYLNNDVADAVLVPASINIVYVLFADGPVGELESLRVRTIAHTAFLAVTRPQWCVVLKLCLAPVYDLLEKGALADMLDISERGSADSDTICALRDENFCHFQAAWCECNKRDMYTAELQRLRKCHAYMHGWSSP